jgi:hypothetical protein
MNTKDFPAAKANQGSREKREGCEAILPTQSMPALVKQEGLVKMIPC